MLNAAPRSCWVPVWWTRAVVRARSSQCRASAKRPVTSQYPSSAMTSTRADGASCGSSDMDSSTRRRFAWLRRQWSTHRPWCGPIHSRPSTIARDSNH